MRRLCCMILVFALFSMTSCGPKRLGCGPRGYCKTEKPIQKIEPRNKQNPAQQAGFFFLKNF